MTCRVVVNHDKTFLWIVADDTGIRGRLHFPIRNFERFISLIQSGRAGKCMESAAFRCDGFGNIHIFGDDKQLGIHVEGTFFLAAKRITEFVRYLEQSSQAVPATGHRY